MVNGVHVPVASSPVEQPGLHWQGNGGSVTDGGAGGLPDAGGDGGAAGDQPSSQPGGDGGGDPNEAPEEVTPFVPSSSSMITPDGTNITTSYSGDVGQVGRSGYLSQVGPFGVPVPVKSLFRTIWVWGAYPSQDPLPFPSHLGAGCLYQSKSPSIP